MTSCGKNFFRANSKVLHPYHLFFLLLLFFVLHVIICSGWLLANISIRLWLYFHQWGCCQQIIQQSFKGSALNFCSRSACHFTLICELLCHDVFKRCSCGWDLKQKTESSWFKKVSEYLWTQQQRTSVKTLVSALYLGFFPLICHPVTCSS